MTDEKLTTVQTDVETRNKLKILAQVNERTQAGQLRWMVNVAFEKLDDSVKLLLIEGGTKVGSKRELPQGE